MENPENLLVPQFMWILALRFRALFRWRHYTGLPKSWLKCGHQCAAGQSAIYTGGRCIWGRSIIGWLHLQHHRRMYRGFDESIADPSIIGTHQRWRSIKAELLWLPLPISSKLFLGFCAKKLSWDVFPIFNFNFSAFRDDSDRENFLETKVLTRLKIRHSLKDKTAVFS